MNLSQLRELKTGDKIIYEGPALTKDKLYTVRETSVGRTILDDNGLGIHLFGIDDNFKFSAYGISGPALDKTFPKLLKSVLIEIQLYTKY